MPMLVCRPLLLTTGLVPTLKARSAEAWVEWTLPGAAASLHLLLF